MSKKTDAPEPDWSAVWWFLLGAMAWCLLALATWLAFPSWPAGQIRKCRSHVEWCKVEQPRLYDAIFGEVEE